MSNPNYLDLHHDVSLNFQLNRLVSTISETDLRSVASRVTDLESWVQEMKNAGAKAEAEGKLIESARYFQGAEFYMEQGAPDKKEVYTRSIELFDRGTPELQNYRVNVPYESGYLPAIRIPAIGTERDTLFIHSGFDGLVEEMYPLLQPFSDAGYTVIAFEGPGQGGALRVSNIHMPSDWERPVTAMLNHFEITECTLIGMSLGGYLAPRAAAFEKRIKRVVSWGAMFEFFSIYKLRLGDVKYRLLSLLMKLGASGVVNRLIGKASETDATMRWAISHGMHVSGTDNPFDFIQWVRSLNLKDSAHLIDQDVLLIMGNEDHLVPKEQLYIQANAMTGARSVTTMMLSEKEAAAQHCQVGNPQLGVQIILEWLSSLERRR